MQSKKRRLGPLLRDTARRGDLAAHVHVLFGGTGAVGGATAFHLIDLLEEATRYRSPDAGEEPRLVVTGLTKQEVRQFTSLLFGLQEQEHGARPTHLEGLGYRTVGGVVVELETFGVDPSIEGLEGFARLDGTARRQAVDEFLAAGGLAADAPREERIGLLEHAIEERVGAPFSEFLRDYLGRRGLPGAAERFRSVVVGIPLASVATYKLAGL